MNDCVITSRFSDTMAWNTGMKGGVCILSMITDFVMCPQLWRKFMKSAGSDDNGLLTASILVASIDQQRNDPEFKDTFAKLCHDFFGVLDVDGDGYLTEDEFSRAFVGILIKDVSFVRTAFESLDVNKDGKLSIEEYTTGLLAYLTTEDELLLWGP